MKFDNYDVALITDEKERLYYLGFHSTAGYVVLTEKKKIFVVDGRYIEAAKKVLLPKGIEVVLGSDYSPFLRYAEENGVKTVGIDFTKTTLSEYETLNSFGFRYVDVSEEIRRETAVKTEEELACLRKACRIAERSWKEVLPEIRVGMTERELANKLEFNFKKYGASGTSFDTIVAFGKNAAVPHHETGDAKLKENECVLMDFGCLYKGYCSDMTRTMFFGEPDEKFLHAYLAVLTAHRKAAEGIRAGMTGKEADQLARDVLESLGYGRYFTHSLGHGIGVNIHEYPLLSPKSGWTLENDMVFSNEPGVYLNGKFGIRIEDSCCLSDGKYVSFMRDDKSLIVLDGKGNVRRRKMFQNT
ncbi:MAG: aminopeptidase P family protein [Candidatus Borkfalkiaceae bacterium]|nr:aminopeptidase P family protein [Christensenellaceae bacterium]